MADFCVVMKTTHHYSSVSSLEVTGFHKVKKSQKYKMRRIKAEISQEWSHETNTRISQRTNPAALKKKSLQTDSS